MNLRLLSLAVLAALLPCGAGAQLRPLDPTPWHVFDEGTAVTASAGVGVYERQRASLAGTEGRLVEIGNFQAIWRSGRIALEAAGTVYRLFEDEASFASPHEAVDGEKGPRRRDSGDYRVATTLLLTPPGHDLAALVRFGTRLPTTDNTVGLERDQTDFFAVAGGSLRRGTLRLAGEAGVGIYGTRDSEYEQSDVLVYALSAEWARGWIAPSLEVLGHADGIMHGTVRGNEELSEMRTGLRLGGRTWVQAQLVTGLMRFSPQAGLLLTAGIAR